jgi:hypothetical protein
VCEREQGQAVGRFSMHLAAACLPSSKTAVAAPFQPVCAGLGTTGLNTVTGTARNPHSTGHHTGGSSSGSAALVAAGICPFAVGELQRCSCPWYWEVCCGASMLHSRLVPPWESERACGPPCTCRQRRRRQHPHPGCAVRCGGPEADARTSGHSRGERRCAWAERKKELRP